MPLRDSVIRVKGRINDVKKRLILPGGYRIFFLKRSGETKRFTVVVEVTSGAVVTYNGFRQQLTLNCAVPDTDTNFPNYAAQTSYWAVGQGYGTGNKTFDVYAVDPERRDVVPPTANNPEWKFYLTREPRERFVLP